MEKKFNETIERVINCEMWGGTKEIVKKVGPDGEAHYFYNGDKVSIYTETLEEIAEYAFAQIENLLRLADDSGCKSDHIPIGEELLEVGQSKLRNAGAFLREQAGEFQIVRVSHRQPGLEGGAFLDVQCRRPLSAEEAA